MTEQTLIDGLISTYQALNSAILGRNEEGLLNGEQPGASAKDVIRNLRDTEMLFSKELKERTTGVAIPTVANVGDSPTLGMETPNDTIAMLLAQFGTARETTLAMLRSLNNAEWDVEQNGVPSIRRRIAELLANDHRNLGELESVMARL